MKKAVPFSKATERSLFGSKAIGLGDATRQGLPVPPGVALSGDLVEAIASGDEKAIEKLSKAIAALSPPFAVRSSAVDEDGAAASFGYYLPAAGWAFHKAECRGGGSKPS